MDADMWQFQMFPLAQSGLRTIAFDARGHSRSDDPGFGFDPDTLADDLSDLLAALDLADVTLVGHSFGCGVVLRYLARHGDRRISGIALLGTTTPFLPSGPDNAIGVDPELMVATRKRWETDLHGWIQENLDPFFVESTPECSKQWITQIAMRTPVRTLIETNRNFFPADFRLDAKATQVPALVIHGTCDASAPTEITAIPTADLIRGSEVRLYEGAPHGLFLTHADLVNADLLAFI
jgi:pimeloyl-ACP methyl ester carboxylesterase